jgi:hypothetical protein
MLGPVGAEVGLKEGAAPGRPLDAGAWASLAEAAGGGMPTMDVSSAQEAP